MKWGGYIVENSPKRKIKDSVFTDLFQNKKYLLQLYKTLHPEDSDVSVATSSVCAAGVAVSSWAIDFDAPIVSIPKTAISANNFLMIFLTDF